jgi:hypothetical protein
MIPLSRKSCRFAVIWPLGAIIGSAGLNKNAENAHIRRNRRALRRTAAARQQTFAARRAAAPWAAGLKAQLPEESHVQPRHDRNCRDRRLATGIVALASGVEKRD